MQTPLIFLSCTLTDDDPSNRQYRPKFAKLLLSANADPNLQDFLGMTAIMHASMRGQDDLVQVLLSNVSRVFPFFFQAFFSPFFSFLLFSYYFSFHSSIFFI